MFVSKINSVSQLGFKGYQHVKNDVGETVTKFNYPYDDEKETCEVEIYRVVPTEKFNYKVIENPIATFKLEKGGKEVNLQRITDLDKDEPFAYRIVRKDKNTGNVIWAGPDTGVKMRPKDLKQDKNGEFVFRVHQDPGGAYDFANDSINNYKYNLVSRKGTTPMSEGPGYLAMPDTFKPGVRYKGFDDDNTGEIYEDKDYQKKIENEVKTFSNMYGGSMAGLEQAVPYLSKNGVKLLFTTPIANGDDRSSHGYWNKNNMQIAPNMGTAENYDSLMVAEFKNGMSHVFDATLTSEGLEGIHVQYNMRWGEQAQPYYWFRMDSLKDEPLSFGVLPENKKNVRHRVINAPYIYELQENGQYKKVKNDNYDSSKETLYQIYDGSQVSEEQLSELDKPIQIYQDLKAGKNLDINNYNDTLVSYVFAINPKEYDKRIDIINDFNKKDKKDIKLDTPEGTIMTAQFSNFRIDKAKEGGYVAWDANTDMVKMNYGISGYDEKNLQAISDTAQRQYEKERRVRGGYEVQDMAVQTGVYWTDKTKTALTLYTAKTVGQAKTIENINKLIGEGKGLPEDVRLTPEQLNNILNGMYDFAPKGLNDNKDEVTIKALMKLPLDSLEFGENVAGVLSTSYFSNRATTEDTVGVSRFDLMKQDNPQLIKPYAKVYNRTNEMFSKELNSFAQSVLKKVDETSDEKLFDADGKYTEYGEYVIDLLGREIAKYALLKSLSGEAFKSKILPNGELTYDYDGIRKATTLKALGINANNPTEEAEILQNKMIKGLKNLSDNDIIEVAKAVSERIKGTDTDSFRIAEAMVDKAPGLNFRLDAAKDVMDIDSVRNRDNDFDDTWTQLIKFWSKYVQGVKSVNPNSYLVAEMTDVSDVMNDNFGRTKSCPYNGDTNVNNVKYNGEPDAMAKFYNETGITSEAAYSYFFTEMLRNFSRDFETGENKCDNHDEFEHKMKLLMNTRSVDYLRNLYTFIGNHDKMRTVHGLAIDTQLFNSSLEYNDFYENEKYKNRPQRIDVIRVLSGAKSNRDIPLELKLNLDNMDYFRGVSARAVAQSKLLMGSVDEDLAGKIPQQDLDAIREALIDLANGNYMNDKETAKMTKIDIPELSSIENAVGEVAKLAGNIPQSDIDKIVEKAYNLDFTNYAIRGDFDWTDERGYGDKNKAALSNIMGTDTNALDYSVYTVQLANMIKDAAKGTSYESKINEGLKDFVKKYNRAYVNEHTGELKTIEDPVIARKKNGYAARDFRVAMEEAINQAEYKTGRTIENKDEIINTVYQSVTAPAVQKYAMMMSFLGALCGIPTLYAGDEFGDTGWEDKAKNTWMQNRNPSLWSKVEDENSEIGKIKRNYQKQMLEAIQNKANLKELQHGTPYMMNVQIDGRDKNEIYDRRNQIAEECAKLSPDSKEYKDLQAEDKQLQYELAKVAFMMQDADGDVAVSVFNAGGIDHGNRVNYFKKFDIEDMKKRVQFFKDNNLDPNSIDNPYVPIQKASTVDALLLGAGVALPIGMIFMNADSRDKAQYVVNKIGDKLGIVRKDGGKIVMDGKTAKNGVMVLRKFLSFKGKPSNNVYTKQFNIVSNPYKHQEAPEEGKKLSLIAK